MSCPSWRCRSRREGGREGGEGRGGRERGREGGEGGKGGGEEYIMLTLCNSSLVRNTYPEFS